MPANRNRFDVIDAALDSLDGDYVVAYSGGLDSTVLLHYLTRTAGARHVRAVHIQHDLHPKAADWARHCQSRAGALGVALTVRPVQVASDSNGGTEAAARDARYAELAATMAPGEVLVTAHHADDQAQTFLLQALRGSGVRGLAAMPAQTAFGPGWHARPMLELTREQIQAYAETHRLQWLDDPSNSDPSIDRSYLNTEIWPLIRQHWPGAATTLSRAADWCAASAEQNQAQADDDLMQCTDVSPDCLSVSHVKDLPQQRQRSLLRHWLEGLGLPPPRLGHLDAIERDCLEARSDAQPVVSWPGAEVRRYRDGLYVMPPLPVVDAHWEAAWTPPEPLALPGGGRLLADCGAGGLAMGPEYRVRFRRPGERLCLPGRAHDTELKTALQEAGVPPWLRDRLPLIVTGERIAAVADLWICDHCAAGEGKPGWHPQWADAPAGWPTHKPRAVNTRAKIR